MIKLEIHVNKMGDCHSVELKKEVKMRNCMILCKIFENENSITYCLGIYKISLKWKNYQHQIEDGRQRHAITGKHKGFNSAY